MTGSIRAVTVAADATSCRRRRCSPRSALRPPHPTPSQITFPVPVVLTSARVGAAPTAGPAGQRAQLLLFAQDASAPAAARFVQLCPGFEQPGSGSRVVQLQVSIRGQPAACIAQLPCLPTCPVT